MNITKREIGTLPKLEAPNLHGLLVDHLRFTELVEFGVRLQIPDFRPFERGTRWKIAQTLRRLATALEAEEPGVARMLGAIDDLEKLEDDWDSEGASKPAPRAIGCARAIITAGAQLDIVPDDVDSDVLGGVALYFIGLNERIVWIACMNSGTETIVFSEAGAVVRHATFELSLLGEVRAFLRGDVDGEGA